MLNLLKRYLLVAGLLFVWGAAFSQATVSPDPPSHVNACGGLANGSISFTVTAGVAPFNLFYFGVGFGQSGFVPVTQGIPVTVPNLQPDTYLLSIADGDAANPNYSTFVTITNIPAVTASLGSKTNNSSCSSPNGQITINAAGGTGSFSYAWTSNNGFGPFPNSNAITNLPGGTYNVTVSDLGSNCTASVNNIVITDPAPAVQTVTTSSPESVCSGSAATISLGSTQVLTLPLSYYEILKNGNPTGVKMSGTGGAITLSLPGGTFANGDILTVRAVDNLCTPVVMSGSVTLNVHTPPTSATLSGTATICAGTSTNLSVAFVGGTGPYSITINNGVGTINNYASGTPIPVSPAATTTYTLTAATDANGCAAQSLAGSAVVTVKPSPTSAVLSGTTSLCAGSGPVNLIVTVTGGTSPYTININNGVGVINNYVSGAPIPVNPAATTTYNMVGNVTDATGCSVAGSGSATVTVHTPPSNATISGNSTICSGTSANIKVTITGGVGPFSVTIDNGVGTINNYASGAAIAVSPLVTTTYHVTAATDANGCNATVLAGSAKVTVKPSPTSAVLSGSTSICGGAGPANLTVTITGGTSPYTININNGVGIINNYVSGTPIPVNPAATTTYSMVGNVTDAGGCSVAGSGSATITVNAPPSNATISGTTSICSGSSTNLVVTITGGVGPFTITIDNGVGVINNYASGASIPVSPLVNTTYHVTAVTDANGCAAQALAGSAIITVKPSPTSAVLSGTATTCATPTNLIVTITGGTSPYSVTINNGVGTINNYVSGTAIPVNPAATTTYSMVGNVTDASGCSVAGSGTATVTVNTPPSNSTINGSATICSGSSTNLSVTITGGVGPYSITINNGVGTINNYISGTPIPVSPAVTTTYNLTATKDANGCAAVALAGSAAVTVNPASTANAGPDQAICSGGTVTLAGAIGGSASTGTWTGGAGSFAPNATTLNAVYTPTAAEVTAGTVNLILTTDDPAGPCVAASDVMIITINAAATANAGPDQGICAGSTATLAGVIGGAATSATWSGGTGSFVPNATTLNATYTPSAAERAAGTVTLTLTTNDPAGACVAATDQMTIAISPTPTANAGADRLICAGSTVVLAGSIGGAATTGTWSGGTGTFTPNATTLNATYTPGAADIAAGTVTLTLITDDPPGPCTAASDQMKITINPPATVSAGPDQIICSGTTATLAGSFGGAATSATWSGGTGTFSPNATTLNAVYTPGAADIAAGSVTLTLTTNNPAGPCNAATDQVLLTITPAATANAGPDQSICSGSTVTLAGAIGGSASIGTWSGGAGAFAPNATTLNAVYTPSAAEITAGTVTLTLTTDDPAGSCIAASDNMVITIGTAATANAGADQNICGGGTVTLAGVIGGSAATGTWTGGTGFFNPNATTLNAVYAPSAAEITAGTVTLTLTTDDPAGACTAASDQMTIAIAPGAIANAGPDQSICAGSTVTLAGAIGGTATIGTWSGGGGTFNPDATTLNAVYTPSAAEVTAGTVTLTLTTDDPPGLCTATSDNMIITISPVATANAGADQTICSGTSATLAGVIGGSAAVGTWSGGTGTFNPDATTLNAVYTPSAAEVAAGTLTLTLTTDDPAGACLAASDQVTITISTGATANAGPDQTICGNSLVTLGGSIGGLAVTGTWSGGTGTFNPNATTLNAVYTPSAAEVTAGTVTLTLTTDDPAGPCPAGTDAMTITINATPGNPPTAGNETWLGYVYDDSGDLGTPLPARIDFNSAKYRGFIDETDIAGMSPFSSYNSATDVFDLNISNNASGLNIHSANVCGTYNDNFSIRYHITKTFAQGVYTFTVGTDDGARLFLDGVPILPGAFINQPYTLYTSAAQCISAGQHDLVLEYYEQVGFSRLTFSYQAAASPTVTTPVTTCINSAAPSLVASSADPLVTGFNWYKDAALTTLLFNGASFTPAAADLNMAVAGTTSFYVTATYACGETLASQVDVTVVNAATITPPAAPAQVCQSAGIIDLTTIVSAVPAGGAFTFSGTGVTVSPNFDPSLVLGPTVITANYTSGTCVASTNFTLNVVNAATITVPAAATGACQSTAPIDMTTLVSAVPTGGTFTFTGPGVAGNFFDPSAQLGAVAVTVNYNAGGCTDSKTLNFNVTSSATLTISNTTTCPTAGLLNLTTLVSAVPAGGVLTFSGPGVSGNNFDPSAFGGSTASVSVGYNLGGCIAVGTISITVNATCGGIGCGVFTISVTDTRPSCTNQNDGIINVSVSGGSPNYIVTLTDGAAFNQQLVGPGPFTYSNLSPANYQVNILDNASNSCTVAHSLPIQSTIQATASNFVDALCFNQPVGSALVTVNSGGAAPYEYSIDGGTTWVAFTSPGTVNNLMPNPSPYSILVRDDASDLCPAQVMVTIGNVPAADIDAPYTVSNATCANNDGSIQIGNVTGGTSPYTYKMDGNIFASLPANNTFTGMSGGNHTFTVIDFNNCAKDFPIVVNFPGLVNFTTAATAPDCAGNGTNGSLVVTVTSVGSFKVGISTDPSLAPATYIDVVSAGSSNVTFPNLSSGTYYVNALSVGGPCPTVTPATISGGPQAVDFRFTVDNIACFANQGGITLDSIVGSAVNYTFEIIQSGTVMQSGTITSLQALSNVQLTGLDKGDYQVRLFQDQSAATGCAAPITSAYKPFTVDGPTGALDTLYVNKTISFPDMASGTMLVGVKESGEEPYEIRIELMQPLFPSQGPLVIDWTAISRNPDNLRMEYSAKNLFAGDYKLSLRDALGCEKDYTITIGVDTDIFIPNIFTPNGDGINDTFFIRNLPSESHVVITNRWGKEVYRNGNYQNDWGAGSIEDGVYYYRISAGGQVFNGWVEIQRALGQ